MAFFGLGIQFCLPRLLNYLGFRVIPFVELAVCLPAAALGTLCWLRARSFANSWPVVLCAVLAWIGLLYADQSESRRGLYYATVLAMTLPLAALIDRHRAWAFCAKAFVVGSMVGSLIVAWIQLWVERGWMNLANVRFGMFYLHWRGTCVTNPNEVGFQLALAAFLAFLLYLRGGAAGRGKRDRRLLCEAPEGPYRQKAPVTSSPALLAGRLGLAWTPLLVAGCMLTVCRGAVVACFAGMGLLALLGTQDQKLSRVKDLMAASAIGLSLVLVVALVSGRVPWGALKARFVGEETVTSLGGRTEIWQNVFRAMRSSPKYLLFGTGTGMASQALGRFDLGAEQDDYGRLYRSCHNLFLDWTLTYGLVGVAAGGCLMLAMLHRAAQLDRRDGTIDRKALLATLALLGMTGVLYQQGYWLATGSLVLAMLSDAPLFGQGRRPESAESPHPLPLSRLRERGVSTELSRSRR